MRSHATHWMSTPSPTLAPSSKQSSHSSRKRHKSIDCHSKQALRRIGDGMAQPAHASSAGSPQEPLLERVRPAADWCQLDEPLLWQGPESDSSLPEATASLTPGFKVMLLSDGSVTRHLQLITNHRITADCLDSRELPGQSDVTVQEVERLQGPIIQRQVLLKELRGKRGSNGASEHVLGPALVYAVSWWNAADADSYLSQRDRPIGTSLLGSELRREISRIVHGSSETLERFFEVKGPFWGREYTIWKGGKPLTVIYEVFSPRLERFFGTCDL